MGTQGKRKLVCRVTNQNIYGLFLNNRMSQCLKTEENDQKRTRNGILSKLVPSEQHKHKRVNTDNIILFLFLPTLRDLQTPHSSNELVSLLSETIFYISYAMFISTPN